MKQGTKNEVKGGLSKVAGKVKEKAGRAAADPKLEAKGQNQQAAGKVRKKVGQIERVFGK